MAPSSRVALTQAEERQNGHNHHNESDQINDPVHASLPGVLRPRLEHRETNEGKRGLFQSGTEVRARKQPSVLTNAHLLTPMLSPPRSVELRADDRLCLPMGERLDRCSPSGALRRS
jgi:hypothetical protein